MSNGTRHKIPEALWEEVYQNYAGGMSVPQVRKLLSDKHQVVVSDNAIYGIIRIMRSEKQKHLNEILDADTDNDMGRLKWLQTQLEEVAVESRLSDKPFFLKVADRLIKVYELKLTLRAVNEMPKLNLTDDNGRAKLLEELQKLS